MKQDAKGIFKKLEVDRQRLTEEFGIDLHLFLDAVSLGLSDEEIADLTGYDLDKIVKLRKTLNNIGSEIGINYKKDFH